MKKLILSVLVFLPFILNAQDIFTINARIGNDGSPAKAYLLYRDGTRIVTDSSILTKGMFTFTGHIQEPTLARLIIDHKGAGFASSNGSSDMTMMYLEKGIIKINSGDSLKRAVFKGSVINTEYGKYKKFMADDGQVARSREQYAARQYDFIKANPDSYVSIFILREAAGAILDLQTVEPAFNSLSPRVKNSFTGKEFKSLIDKKRSLTIGQSAPDFTQNDPDDKPVKLSDFKGKYVLLDFWASWCMPCRAENPFVVKAYNKYKDQDFTVLSVSLDRPGKKADWLTAIKADGLTWTQVSDLQFWNNQAAQIYGINSIPQNFLLDKTGKIVAVNLRGEELDKSLEKLLRQQQAK